MWKVNVPVGFFLKKGFSYSVNSRTLQQLVQIMPDILSHGLSPHPLSPYCWLVGDCGCGSHKRQLIELEHPLSTNTGAKVQSTE
jgi:hypothetical protein